MHRSSTGDFLQQGKYRYKWSPIFYGKKIFVFFVLYLRALPTPRLLKFMLMFSPRIFQIKVLKLFMTQHNFCLWCEIKDRVLHMYFIVSIPFVERLSFSHQMFWDLGGKSIYMYKSISAVTNLSHWSICLSVHQLHGFGHHGFIILSLEIRWFKSSNFFLPFQSGIIHQDFLSLALLAFCTGSFFAGGILEAVGCLAASLATRCQ